MKADEIKSGLLPQLREATAVIHGCAHTADVVITQLLAELQQAAQLVKQQDDEIKRLAALLVEKKGI